MIEAGPTGEPPVLLVHGIWDDGTRFCHLQRALEAARRRVETIDLVPNDGSAPIRALADAVARHVEAMRDRHRVDRIDLVGFSMGALVARTFIQRSGGRLWVRRFVSISGPQHGTVDAHVFALSKRHHGIADMRPGSALLQDLASDVDPWGTVETHVLYTPLDLMILPAASSELPKARTTTRVSVPLHHMMISHPKVLRLVVERLAGPTS